MPFVEEFSRAWQCTAPSRNRTEEQANECVHSACYNGICSIKWIQTDFGGTVPFGTCLCDEFWTGRFCDKCCDMPCNTTTGFCQIDFNTELPYCNCLYKPKSAGVFCDDWKNFTDNNYTKYVTETVNSTSWEIPVIVSSVLIVLLAVSIYATLYSMYKRRHQWLVKIIVKYHSKFMDDTDRTYDAYISYRTDSDKDRKFVVFRLLPFLEQEGYSVCIDQRDFIPGAAIANSIAEAIAESRRTILVLSPSYVEGEWEQFEIQCSIKESLKNNHRIIPVILEPLDSVKEETSPTLQHIVDFITCIKWPVDTPNIEEKEQEHSLAKLRKQICNRIKIGKTVETTSEGDSSENEKNFWKRLLLTLPRRTKQDESVPNDQEKAITSFQSQVSVQSTTSESHELLDISRNGKSNLFDRRHFDNVFAIQRTKVVQVVHPQPRYCPKLHDEEQTTDIKKTEESIDSEIQTEETSQTNINVNAVRHIEQENRTEQTGADSSKTKIDVKDKKVRKVSAVEILC